MGFKLWDKIFDWNYICPFSQGYFGYVETEGMEARVKSKEEASQYVSKMLWPPLEVFGHKKLSPSAQILLKEENEKLLLSKVLNIDEKGTFRDTKSFLVKDADGLKALFESGRTRNAKEQTLVIDGFRVKTLTILYNEKCFL